LSEPTFSESGGGAVTVTQLAAGGEAAWTDYVERHPQATSAHAVQWKRLIETVFGKKCYYLQAFCGGALVGVLPLVHMRSLLFGNYMVSVPYVNYGGVLADNAVAEAALLKEAAELARRLGGGSIEFRESVARATDAPCRTDKVAMILQLPATEEALSKQLGSKLRSQIKRPQRENPEPRLGREELLDDFYEVFARNMRDLGTPVYTKALFRTVLQEFPSSYLVVIFLQGRPVSAAFLLGYRDMLEIPWASTIEDVNPLSMNMLLYWEVLRSAVARGYQRFDFGRSTVDAGTFRFKKQWGAEPRQLYWYYWLDAGREMPNLKPDNPKFNFVIRCWQKLPVPVTQLIGPHIVKHLP
jgi:FemAB-related protein (PEP-CTERM system-associated)